jgi:hypothetical protein
VEVGLGELVGVDVGVLVGVDVGVSVGVDVGVLVGVDVGVLVGVDVGVDEGVMDGVEVGLGEVPVKNDLPSEVSVTKTDWTHLTLPVPPCPVKHPTAHSAVWPGPRPASERRLPTVAPASSVPPKALVTLPTAGDIRPPASLPLVSNSASCADT